MTPIWHSFGDRDRFAFEFAFYPDPDGEAGPVRYDSASWGAFRLWVRGVNLCEHKVGRHFDDAVHWYLHPVFDWLAANWDPLLHETRLPGSRNEASARAEYYAVLRRAMRQFEGDSDDRERAWDGWWRRHALRTSRSGGLFPDVFLRRVQDFIEVSWGHCPLPGMPSGFVFVNSEGLAHVPVSEVADPLESALWKTYALMAKLWPSEETQALARRLDAIRNGSDATREMWYVAGTPEPAGVGEVFAAVSRHWTKHPDMGAAAALRGTSKGTYLDHLSPMVAMFGTASPTISAADAEFLARTMVLSFTDGRGESDELQRLVDDRPLSRREKSYEEGYELALDLLDELDAADGADGRIDIEALVTGLGIDIIDEPLSDRAMRGVAIAGDGQHPTILLNNAHPANRYESGRRFTLAHELCHILHDRSYGRSLALVSGPWAPAGVEQRANAFAAMVLMPEPVLKSALACATQPFGTVDWAQEIALRVGVGLTSTVHHLHNLGVIGESVREEILAEIDAARM